MRNELTTYEQIDRYLSRQLSGEELSAFENRIKTDTSFAKEVNAHRFINDLVIDEGLLDIKKKLRVIDAGKNTSGNRRLHKGLLFIFMLASIGYVISYYQTEPPVKKVTQGTEKPSSHTPTVVIPSAKATDQKHFQSTKEKIEDQSLTADKKSANTQVNPRDVLIKKTTDTVDISVLPFPIPKYKEPEPEHRNVDVVHQPCQLGNSALQITAQESCINSPTGKIVISKTSSLHGQAPFLFSIDGKNFTATYTFENIYAGTYVLSVKDAQGCLWSDTEVRVGEKDCSLYEFAFYPAKQEIWKFPIENIANGTIEIYNKTGRLVYHSQIINNYPDSWNGTSEDQLLPMGSYSFILRSGDQVLDGNVTLLR